MLQHNRLLLVEYYLYPQIRAEAEKTIMHWPDLAVQLRADHSAVVRAVRGTQLAVGTVIRSSSAKMLLAEMAPKQTAATA